MRLKIVFIAITTLFMLAGNFHTARATTLDVTDCTFAALSGTIASTFDGDIVQYVVPCASVNFSATINITTNITLSANGNAVTFDGRGSVQLFNVTGVVVFDGFTLQNGYSAGDGGAIASTSQLIIANCTFLNNISDGAGGAVSANAIATVSNSTFTNNTAVDSGGGLYLNSIPFSSVSNNTFTGNRSTADEGGGLSMGNGTLTGNTFINNSAIDGGGADMSRGSVNATATGNSFINNTASDSGGGLLIAGGSAIGSVSGNVFSGNSAIEGGGLYMSGGSGVFTITNNTFANNSATLGGGLHVLGDGSATLVNNTFFGNSATNGGGYYDGFSATVTLTHNTFASNTASSGSAIHYDIPFPPTFDVQYNIISGTCFQVVADATNLSDVGCDSATIAPDLGLAGFDGAVVQLLLGSPAIDNYPAPCDVGNDQLGNARPQLTGCDVGSFETDNPLTAPVVSPVTPSVTVLGCALDSTDGVDVANAPDNTYCRILMRNGSVIGYSGAIPADLISLGVILAVDVYRLEGGMSINTFPAYARICLSGIGRYFYMDARNAPRYSVEMPTERVDGLTCAWIPAPGTVILTN